MPTGSRCRGRTARACRRPDTRAGANSATGWVTRTRRCAEHGAVYVRTPKPECECELSACRDPAHRGALGGQHDAEPRPRPRPDVVDEEPLVRREPVRVEPRAVLV